MSISQSIKRERGLPCSLIYAENFFKKALRGYHLLLTIHFLYYIISVDELLCNQKIKED